METRLAEELLPKIAKRAHIALLGLPRFSYDSARAPLRYGRSEAAQQGEDCGENTQQSQSDPGCRFVGPRAGIGQQVHAADRALIGLLVHVRAAMPTDDRVGDLVIGRIVRVIALVEFIPGWCGHRLKDLG